MNSGCYGLSVPPPSSDHNSNKNNQNQGRKMEPKIPAAFSMSRRRWILSSAALLTVPPLLGEVYARTGPTSVKNYIDIPDLSKAEELTLVFHGAGGQDNNTDILMKRLQSSSSSKKQSVLIDWSQLSMDTLRASFNGQRVGQFVALKLGNDSTALKKIHVIGISVGAFAADACVTAMRDMQQQKDEKTFIQLTLLDPFTARGVLDFRYGIRNFGRSSDYAQQFMNTDDPVPSTNEALPRCGCTDVTKLRPLSIFGHDWPLVYYSTKAKNLGFVPSSMRIPRGTVVVQQPDGTSAVE